MRQARLKKFYFHIRGQSMQLKHPGSWGLTEPSVLPQWKRVQYLQSYVLSSLDTVIFSVILSLIFRKHVSLLYDSGQETETATYWLLQHHIVSMLIKQLQTSDTCAVFLSVADMYHTLRPKKENFLFSLIFRERSPSFFPLCKYFEK